MFRVACRSQNTCVCVLLPTEHPSFWFPQRAMHTKKSVSSTIQTLEEEGVCGSVYSTTYLILKRLYRKKPWTVRRILYANNG